MLEGRFLWKTALSSRFMSFNEKTFLPGSQRLRSARMGTTSKEDAKPTSCAISIKRRIPEAHHGKQKNHAD